MNAKQSFDALRAELSSSMVERDAEIDSLLLGLVAQEHVLLVGPPGTGKSLLATNLTRAIEGAKVFQVLLTKFTTPEELFGPIKLTALREDRYERAVDGYAPKADILFIDEVWKASSAILNTTLTLLQERMFDNGGKRMQCPLKLAVAASNEWPSVEEGQELGAVFDRFLIRRVVHTVTPASRDALLYGTMKPVNTVVPKLIEMPQALLDCDPLRRPVVSPLSAAAEVALRLGISPEARAAFSQILDELTGAGIRPGDRRSRKAVKIAQARAWLDGDTEVKPHHLECLGDVLWSSPEQIDPTTEIVTRIANPVGAAVAGLMKEVAEIEAEVAAAQDSAAKMVAIKKLEELEKKAKGHAANGGGTRAAGAVAHVRKRRMSLQAAMLGISEERAAAFLAEEGA